MSDQFQIVDGNIILYSHINRVTYVSESKGYTMQNQLKGGRQVLDVLTICGIQRNKARQQMKPLASNYRTEVIRKTKGVQYTAVQEYFLVGMVTYIERQLK